MKRNSLHVPLIRLSFCSDVRAVVIVTLVTYQVSSAVTLLTCILAVSSLNLGQNIHYVDLLFHVRPQALQIEANDLFLLHRSQIHYLLIILSSGLVCSEMLTAPRNT